MVPAEPAAAVSSTSGRPASPKIHPTAQIRTAPAHRAIGRWFRSQTSTTRTDSKAALHPALARIRFRRRRRCSRRRPSPICNPIAFGSTPVDR
jgi:hypothetical protein